MRPDALVKAAVAALEDIKGRDIVVLDVRKLTALFDKVVIVSADSSRQIRALSSHLQEKLKALGARIHGVEGERASDWILVDLGPVIVHIMLPAVRKYYNLEELWAPPRTRRRRAGAAAP
ncbi:MAG TPA: ribosome silencing factor [Burkholderiales bacterium]|jgi:ribosome-associated protein